jgi:hypothetical protein
MAGILLYLLDSLTKKLVKILGLNKYFNALQGRVVSKVLKITLSFYSPQSIEKTGFITYSCSLSGIGNLHEKLLIIGRYRLI